VRWWCSLTREEQVRNVMESKAKDKQQKLTGQARVGCWKQTWAAVSSLTYIGTGHSATVRAIVRASVKMTPEEIEKFQFEANMGKPIAICCPAA
jgi:hypothetical protein